MGSTEWIEEWIGEYNITGVTIVVDTTYESGSYLGMTSYVTVNDETTITIKINTKMVGSIVEKGIAWHEFAHALNYVENARTGHNLAWLKCLLRKPLLAILPYVCFPVILFRLLSHR